MARFAIDARVITAERDGIGRYGRELVPALAAAAPSDTFLVLRHPSNRDPLPGIGGNVEEVFVDGAVDRLVDHYLLGHRRLSSLFDARGWPDVYHSLFPVVPRRFPVGASRRPAVVATLHDLIWLEQPFAHGNPLIGAATWLTARTAIIGTLRRADRVITGSAASAARAERWIARGRVDVVHHGVNQNFRCEPPPLPASFEALRDGRPWIAAVGNHKRYKNLRLLLEAFAMARGRGVAARLVLVGPCRPLVGLARRRGVGDDVLFLGEADDDALRAVVGRASLFVHPALVEGFGMPVVEAMALGTPTAVADVPVLREVAGDGARHFHPRDANELADIIVGVLASSDTRRDLSARARMRSLAFDWDRCARETLAVYRRAMQGGRA